ncbi:MAG: hypothetical protein QM741_14715 [Rudaea sp.]|uniref:hypothetical protein n=1 Tax=Rudaea sp. TaxID=2136325 RepID=UPI0039E509B3
MQLRPDIQIRSMLKALTEVVLPAVDPGNPLAQEQTRLCIGMLSLMATQLPLQFRFDKDELARLVDLGQRLGATPGADTHARQALAADIDGANDVLARAGAEPGELVDAIRALRASTGAVVSQSCAEAKPDEIREIERAVLDASGAQLLRDRAWVLPQGWEADPKALPPIESLIGAAQA